MIKRMDNNKFIELVTKHLTGEISKEEGTELKKIIDNDKARKEQYNALCLYWNHTDTEYTDDTISFRKIRDKINKLEANGVDAEIITLSPLPSNKNTSYFWRIAVAVILFTACLYLASVYFLKSGSVTDPLTNNWQQKITVKGAKSVITLSDGTHVTLNSQSTLKYPLIFTGKTREVILNGEAYFDVKKDAGHPFIIHTVKLNIKVLGTSFNIKSYPNEPVSETTLIRGTIEVTLKDRPSDRIILKPEEKLIVKNNSLKKTGAIPGGTDNVPGPQYVLTSLSYLHKNDSTISETSWINNRFAFDNDSFLQLAEKMERWYGVNIQFKNEAVKQYHFSGIFENDSITQALNYLREIEKFNYKISESTIYIY